MVEWREEISRGLAHSAMDSFPTFADAAAELIDNPIDFRHGRKLTVRVTVDKPKDLMVFEDFGGEGMDAEGIADRLKWGTGRPHQKGDISIYRQGGKAACGYLADSLVLYAKRAGSDDVWKFEDSDWRGRTDARDWGEPSPVADKRALPASVANCPKGQGIVRIELRRLRSNYMNVEKLKWRLSSTYLRLIEAGDVVIWLGKDKVEPLELPLSSAFTRREVNLKTSAGHRIRGWVGRLDRDALVIPKGKFHVKAGLRCCYAKRLIADGQAFGHNLEGKGLLASLIGEVDLDFVRPIPNKTDFSRSSPEWAEAEHALFEFLAPIVAELRQAGEKRPIAREEKKLLSKVCEDLGEALRRLNADPLGESGDGGAASGRGKDDVGRGGRRSPTPRGGHRIPHQGGSRGPTQEPTPPPEVAVGILVRKLAKITGGSTKPPAVLESLDPSVRSQWRPDPGSPKIVVNVEYPLYKEFQGSEPYLAETVVMQLAQPLQEGEVKTLEEFLAEVDNMLRAWAEVKD